MIGASVGGGGTGVATGVEHRVIRASAERSQETMRKPLEEIRSNELERLDERWMGGKGGDDASRPKKGAAVASKWHRGIFRFRKENNGIARSRGGAGPETDTPMCSYDDAGAHDFDASISLICEESEDFEDEDELGSFCQDGKRSRLSTSLHQVHPVIGPVNGNRDAHG